MVIVVSSPIFVAEEGAPSVPQGVADLKALDFDGSTEYLANDTEQSIGIANAWTIGQWINFDTLGAANQSCIRIRSNSGNQNRIEIFWDASDNLNINLQDGTPTLFKDYDYSSNGGFSTSAGWQFFILTWDGSTLQLYTDGSPVSPSATPTDDSGTQSDSNRTINIANRDLGGFEFNGQLHSTMLWGKALSSDTITDIYNGGAGGVVDLREVQGNYSQDDVDNLQHYWRHGFNSGDIGEDLGNGTAIDVGDNAANITAADIVDDYPGI